MFRPDDMLLSCSSNLESIHIFDMQEFMEEIKEIPLNNSNFLSSDKSHHENQVENIKTKNQKSKY